MKFDELDHLRCVYKQVINKADAHYALLLSQMHTLLCSFVMTLKVKRQLTSLFVFVLVYFFTSNEIKIKTVD